MTRRRLRSDHQVLLFSLAAGLPGTAIALAVVWGPGVSPAVRWLVTVLVPLAWLTLSLTAARRFVRPLQTLANVLAALRVGDFSIRGHGARADDPLDLVMVEANHLADSLRQTRLGGMEAEALLRAVLSEIDVVIVALDEDDRIQFANRAAEALLGHPAGGLTGMTAREAGIDDLLRVETPATIDHAFPGGSGRWDLRRGTFRQEGVPHRLLVLADVGRALRQEEREAWRRLIRVLSHEINNSLAPIQSISRGLLNLMDRDPPEPDWDADLRQGLAVIAGRSEALARFMTSYARLARLPPPRRRPVDVGELVGRAVRLETGAPVELRGGPAVTVEADPDQVEQVLINLLRNAAEAVAETGGAVEAGWTVGDGSLAVWIRDEGPGLAATGNLFVPFFTTKPRGTGIGLALSRQIAEAHGGTVELRNREDRTGCEAVLVLPLA